MESFAPHDSDYERSRRRRNDEKLGKVLGVILGILAGLMLWFGLVVLLSMWNPNPFIGLALVLIGLIAAIWLGVAIGYGLGEWLGGRQFIAFFVVPPILVSASILFLQYRNWSIPQPKADAFSLAVLVGAFLAISLVVYMRIHMAASGRGSRAILYYKMWHFPALLAGNLLNASFWVLALAVGSCVVVVALFVGTGYVLGAVGGLAGCLIGAVVGLYVSALLSDLIVRRMADEVFLTRLRNDMFSPGGRLFTVDAGFVFPTLCALQSAVLLGMTGAMIGDLLAKRHVHPGMVAVVCAFFGFLCAQVLNHMKSQAKQSKLRLVSLSLLQAAVVGLLLLPAKRYLADMPFASMTFSHLADLFGGDLTLDAVIVGVLGVAAGSFRGLFRGY